MPLSKMRKAEVPRRVVLTMMPFTPFVKSRYVALTVRTMSGLTSVPMIINILKCFVILVVILKVVILKMKNV